MTARPSRPLPALFATLLSGAAGPVLSPSAWGHATRRESIRQRHPKPRRQGTLETSLSLPVPLRLLLTPPPRFQSP